MEDSSLLFFFRRFVAVLTFVVCDTNRHVLYYIDINCGETIQIYKLRVDFFQVVIYNVNNLFEIFLMISEFEM